MQGDLRKALDEAESFALGEYTLALAQGNDLAPERRREIAQKVARLTGLTPGYAERVTKAYYECGHMMYIRKADREKLKRDLAAFYRAAGG